MYLKVVVRPSDAYLAVAKVRKAGVAVEIIPISITQGMSLVKGLFPSLQKEVKWYRP